MKTLFVFTIACLALSLPAIANSVFLNENFETGLPTSAPSAETSSTLSSGTWTLNGVFGKTDNGSVRLAMNTNGYAILPTINQPTSISFNHRGSGSGKILTVQKSLNGTSWTDIGTATVSSSSTYGSSTISVGEAGSQNVRIRLVCGSATIYIDNVVVEVSEMPVEPTVQSSITAQNITGSTADITITAGNGEGRMLVYRKSSDISWVPEDGIVYKAGNWADENHFVAAAGNDLLVPITGLEAGENYFFGIFEYNGTGANRNYLNTNPGKTQILTLQIPSITVSHTSLNFGVVKVGNTEKREFTVSAKYLATETGEITIKGNETFKISSQIATGYDTILILPYTANTLTATKIYAQFTPVEYTTYNKKIIISGGNAPEQQIQLFGTGSNTDAKVYYISPNGDDSNEGTFDAPLKNLQVAVDKMLPGDTVFVRGGIYYPSYKKDGTKTTVRLTAVGTAQKRLCIFNYPGEFPILNFKDQPKAVSVRGIQLDGNYWHIKGIHITEAGDNGIKLEGNYNIVEACTFSYNDDTGIQLGFGHVFSDTYPGISSNDGSYCANNLIVDCDSYFNYDTDNFGSDADGFACKMHNGKNNRFVRCRAWDNSDDAWDLFETDYPVYLIECWGWGSGRAANFPQGGGSFQGNGNGIKLGGNGTGGSSEGKHEAWYCIAFNNNKSGSVKGFDQNSHKGGIKLVNCLAFGNGYDYMFETADGVREFYNNVCFGSIELAAGATQGNNACINNPAKGWTTNVCSSFSASDYNSLTETDAKKPRGADGSMPLTFGRLKQTSQLLNKGTLVPNTNPELSDAGLPWAFSGIAPDLGPYEFIEEPTSAQIIITKEKKTEITVFPNPINNHGSVKFSSNNTGIVSISLYSLNGQYLSTLLTQQVCAGIDYYVPINVSNIPSGSYILSLKKGDALVKTKLIIVK